MNQDCSSHVKQDYTDNSFIASIDISDWFEAS